MGIKTANLEPDIMNAIGLNAAQLGVVVQAAPPGAAMNPGTSSIERGDVLMGTEENEWPLVNLTTGVLYRRTDMVCTQTQVKVIKPGTDLAVTE